MLRHQLPSSPHTTPQSQSQQCSTAAPLSIPVIQCKTAGNHVSTAAQMLPLMITLAAARTQHQSTASPTPLQHNPYPNQGGVSVEGVCEGHSS